MLYHLLAPLARQHIIFNLFNYAQFYQPDGNITDGSDFGRVKRARDPRLMQFALKMDLNNAHRVGLSNQNVLVDDTASDGEAIMAPANGNWQAIKDYVKQQLYN